MARSKKSQYTKKEERIIYILISPLSKEFYVGHCKKTLLKDIFKHHYYGQRNYTKKCFLKLKEQNLRPCLFVLEEITSTKVEAYKYVIAWTKIFIETGHTTLNTGNILHYIEDLYDDSLIIYKNNKEQNLTEICNCKNCFVSQYNHKKCPLYSGEKDDN